MNTNASYPLSRLRDFGATISDTITFLKMNLKGGFYYLMM